MIHLAIHLLMTVTARFIHPLDSLVQQDWKIEFKSFQLRWMDTRTKTEVIYPIKSKLKSWDTFFILWGSMDVFLFDVQESVCEDITNCLSHFASICIQDQVNWTSIIFHVFLRNTNTWIWIEKYSIVHHYIIIHTY